MTSKNSFWINLKENAKRRNWVFFLGMVGFFLYYPVTLLLFLGSSEQWLMNMEKAARILELREDFMAYIGHNGFAGVATFFFAVVAAIQGFSYLYSKKKVDFYFSVPVKPGKRFGIIVGNSVLIFTICYLFNLMLAILLAIPYQIINFQVVMVALSAFLMNLIFFLTIYAVILVAVMMTGTQFITILAAGVFFGYEILIRLFYYGLSSFFFQHFSHFGSANTSVETSITMPFLRYIESISSTTPWASFLGGIAGNPIILTVIYMAIAYFLYRKRPAEASERGIAFAITKPYIKIALLVPIIIVTGMLFGSTVNSTGEASVKMWIFWLFGGLLGMALGHAIIQILFESDLRAVLKNVKSTMLALVVSLVVLGIFVFDLIGFDRYRVSENELTSIGVVFDGQAYATERYDEFFAYMSADQYAEKYINITDVEPILSLIEANQDVSGEYDGVTSYTGMHVIYKLKNGKNVWRYYRIKEQESLPLLDQISEQDSYRNFLYQMANEEYTKDMRSTAINMTIGNELQKWNVDNKEKQALWDAWKMDVKDWKYSDSYNQPVGTIEFHYTTTNDMGNSHTRDWTYVIYQSDTNTLAWLDRMNYNLDAWKDVANVEKVVVNAMKSVYDERGQYWYTDFSHELGEITDTEELQSILPFIKLNQGGGYKDINSELKETTYYLEVFFKENSDIRQVWGVNQSYSAYLYNDEVPDVIQKRAAKHAK